MQSLKIVSNFNTNILAKILIKNCAFSRVKSSSHDDSYEGIFSIDTSCEYLVLWLDISIFPSYSTRDYGNSNCLSLLLFEVNEYLNKLDLVTENYSKTILVNWDDYFKYRGDGSACYKPWGSSYLLDSVRCKTAKKYNDNRSITVIDFRFIAEKLSEYGLDERLYYATKCPFQLEYLELASLEIQSAINTIKGQSKKLVVLDLDNTLWGGVIGDDGIGGIRLGGHDPIGESYTDFQKEIKKLDKLGYQLAISSKNYEETVIKVFEYHPDMVLKKEDFVSMKINWDNKSKNIRDIYEEINIKEDSVVFFDDNPYEREEVSRTCENIFSPKMPNNPPYLKKFLKELRCFDKLVYTKEDRSRTTMYKADKKRKQSLSESLNKNQWLANIDLKLEYEQICETNENRAIQLINKTNQFNLTSRRLTHNELKKLLKDHNLICFRSSDKFGDYGVISVVIYKIEKHIFFITDFVMSCRIMSREIENGIIGILAKCAVNNSCNQMIMDLIITDKNRAIRDFLNENYSSSTNDGVQYCINNLQNITTPKHISVINR